MPPREFRRALPQATKAGRRKRRPGRCLRVRMHQAARRRRRAGHGADGPWAFLAIVTAVLGEALARPLVGLVVHAAARPRVETSAARPVLTSLGTGCSLQGLSPPVPTLPADTGMSLFERPRTDYLPPLSLGDAALARALDYLVRNGGGRHGPATEAQWRTVDAASLPLGVYLRHVDDRYAWRSLQREVVACAVTGARPVLREDRDLGREKLNKLAALSLVWATRGTFLLLDGSDRDDAAPTPELVPHDDLDTISGPGRR
jgi:hypothetical protein